MTTVAETRARGASWNAAPLAGGLAVVLWVIGIIVRETAVEMKTPHTARLVSNEEGSILLGGWLWVLGTFFFFWFLGSFRARLAAAEGGVQRLTAIAFGGGVAAAVFGFALPGPDMAAAIADGADLSGPAAVAIRVVGDVFFLGAEMSAAVLLAASGGARAANWLAPALARLGQPRGRACADHPADRLGGAALRVPALGARRQLPALERTG